METNLMQIYRTVGLSAAGLVASLLVIGCGHRHHPDRDDQQEIVDVHGYHHQGYRDEHGDWHGGFYDEQHQYHDDPHDWH